MRDTDDHAFTSGSEPPVHRLNLNLLYPLDAILHAPTLTEAGRRVRLGQSAMSHALRRLRGHFDDDLVIYSGAERRLTALGLALRADVRRLLRDFEGAMNLSLAFDPLTTTDTITIAASESAEQMVLGPVLRGLSAAAPGLVVDLLALNVEQPQRALDQGADLLLLPAEAAIAGMESAPIMVDQAACMIWNQHPGLRGRDDISEAQYRAARHIIARGEMTASFPTDPSGMEMLRARRVCVRTTSQATLPTIVIGSDLVATGSMWLFQYYASIMPLRVVTAPFKRRESTIVAQWAGHRPTPMVAWFIGRIKAHHPHFRA